MSKSFNDVILNNDWFPLKDIDIKKPGQYLFRSKNETYKECISILVVQDLTWCNGLWTFLNGNSFQLSNSVIEHNEICGPIIFNE